jgi:hypothetical protein
MAAQKDIRPWIYAGFDLLFAVIYAVLLSTVASNRHWWAQLLLWSVTACVTVMGAAMFVRKRWAWLAAAISGATMLALTVVILILILVSAGFLAGVYGAFGKAASAFSMLGAALIVELFALLPLFQLKYLMTRAGRRAFDLPPLWKPRS